MLEPSLTGNLCNVTMCSITAMAAYTFKSTKELRFEDYTLGNNFGSTAAVPAPTSSSVLTGTFGGFSFGFPARSRGSMPGPSQQQQQQQQPAAEPWPAAGSSSAAGIIFGGQAFNVQSCPQVSDKQMLCTSGPAQHSMLQQHSCRHLPACSFAYQALYHICTVCRGQQISRASEHMLRKQARGCTACADC
jgi:hypothetical protein